MKKTDAADVEAQAKAIHRDVRETSHIQQSIAHDLHGGIALLSEKLDHFSEKLDAVAEAHNTIQQESGSRRKERDNSVATRLAEIEESLNALADTLNAVLADRHATTEKARAEVAGAMALIAKMDADDSRSRPQGSKASGVSQTPDESADPSKAFIGDIEPFLYGLPITYVDVGAYEGSVFDQLLRSRIHVFNAHLIEPNPETFEGLKEKLSTYSRPSRLRSHQFAVSDTRGVVTMRAANDMSHVLPSHTTASSAAGAHTASFQVDAIPLDDFASSAGIEHIHLLKVDVEGHELKVFEGARELLEKQSIDIIYVEAGLDPSNQHLVYYRSIEDVLLSHNYRLFKIYEQQHEWLQDSPLLRRFNMAFMSARFAANNSYRLTHELFATRRKNNELQQEISRIKNSASEHIRHASDAIENNTSPGGDTNG